MTDVPRGARGAPIRYDDAALIGQYIGPRLPEGATELPAGATIEWWLV